MARGALSISHWPAVTEPPILDITLGDLLRRAAAETPDRDALVEGSAASTTRRRWTYRALLHDAEAVARALLAQFEPGERVALYAANSPEWMLLQLGCALAGLILAPINPGYTLREALHVIADCEAAVLFHDRSYRGRDLCAVVAGIEAAALPALRRCIPIDTLSAMIAEAPASIRMPRVEPRDTLQIQYTSGTTGAPKGGLLHHQGVINTARNIALRAGFPDGGVHINAMPMFHIAGAHVAELGVLALRGAFVLMPHFDARLMMQLFEEERGGATLIVPTMMLGILDHPERGAFDLSSWRTTFTGAANVPAALVNRMQETFGCQVCIIFGQTESNGPITLTAPGDALVDQTETVGQPLPHANVRIVDPQTLVTAPLGTIGEIWVKGYQTMAGYYNQPAKSQEALRPDGWLRTGDLGTMDARGYLKITGRLKEMIIRGGVNLYPKEMEDVLFDHAAVDQVAVLGVSDEKWGEIVAAVVMARDPRQPPSVEILRAHCAERLAAYKIPHLWYFVEDYPLTASGKIQKTLLKQWIEEKQITAV